MIYYKLVKISSNVSGLAKVIIDVIVRYHSFAASIFINKSLLFILKVWSLLCYFVSIKQSLSITFHPQTNSQTEQQNSRIEAYLQVFVNFEQNNWTRLLPMHKFAYNNAKNANTGHTFYALSCGYYTCVFFKENTDPHFQSKLAYELSAKLQDLITVCYRNLYHI